jgi:hypothetical protein
LNNANITSKEHKEHALLESVRLMREYCFLRYSLL